MKMTKKQRGCLIGCLIALAAIFLTPIGTIPYGIYHGLVQRHRLENAIAKDLPDIANACISLTQLLPTNEWFMSVNIDDPKMPEIIRQTKCRNAGVKQDVVDIEMHGGFDHFGIRVRRSEETNVWQILRYWEGGDQLLMIITNESKVLNRTSEVKARKLAEPLKADVDRQYKNDTKLY